MGEVSCGERLTSRRVFDQGWDLECAPDRVYAVYRQVVDHPKSLTRMEVICANPWTFPNLLKDERFVAEIRDDGRFVEFLEHFQLLGDREDS